MMRHPFHHRVRSHASCSEARTLRFAAGDASNPEEAHRTEAQEKQAQNEQSERQNPMEKTDDPVRAEKGEIEKTQTISAQQAAKEKRTQEDLRKLDQQTHPEKGILANSTDAERDVYVFDGVRGQKQDATMEAYGKFKNAVLREGVAKPLNEQTQDIQEKYATSMQLANDELQFLQQGESLWNKPDAQGKDAQRKEQIQKRLIDLTDMQNEQIVNPARMVEKKNWKKREKERLDGQENAYVEQLQQLLKDAENTGSPVPANLKECVLNAIEKTQNTQNQRHILEDPATAASSYGFQLAIKAVQSSREVESIGIKSGYRFWIGTQFEPLFRDRFTVLNSEVIAGGMGKPGGYTNDYARDVARVSKENLSESDQIRKWLEWQDKKSGDPIGTKAKHLPKHPDGKFYRSDLSDYDRDAFLTDKERGTLYLTQEKFDDKYFNASRYARKPSWNPAEQKKEPPTAAPPVDRSNEVAATENKTDRPLRVQPPEEIRDASVLAKPGDAPPPTPIAPLPPDQNSNQPPVQPPQQPPSAPVQKTPEQKAAEKKLMQEKAVDDANAIVNAELTKDPNNPKKYADLTKEEQEALKSRVLSTGAILDDNGNVQAPKDNFDAIINKVFGYMAPFQKLMEKFQEFVDKLTGKAGKKKEEKEKAEAKNQANARVKERMDKGEKLEDIRADAVSRKSDGETELGNLQKRQKLLAGDIGRYQKEIGDQKAKVDAASDEAKPPLQRRLDDMQNEMKNRVLPKQKELNDIEVEIKKEISDAESDIVAVDDMKKEHPELVQKPWYQHAYNWTIGSIPGFKWN